MTTATRDSELTGVNVAVLSEGRVLLMLRSELPVHCLPGGRIEPGETPEQAAVREVAEETGLEVELEGRVGVYVREQWRPHGDRVAVFAARAVGGALRAVDGEAAQLGYFALGALPNTLVYWHRQRIADAAAGVRGVEREQPFEWRYAAASYRELVEAVERGEVSAAALVADFTGQPRQG
ncbi:MAG: NUDIX domain-containing protein [Myxococcales bacterium]|nr:NUDIX domain-containing protein [Myxococcales bacterium]